MNAGPGIILLVEDNPADEALAIRALRKAYAQHAVVTARDGVQAIDLLFGQNTVQIDDCRLVLLDLKLPKIDGLEVLKRIRSEERTRLLPVVVFSSSRESEDVRSCYREGANSFVCKPIDAGMFTTTMQQLGGYWLECNEPPPARGR